MPSLDALMRNTAEVDVPVMGDVIKVTYKPGIITDEWLNTDKSVIDSLVDVMASWNLTQGAGKAKRTIPITKASLGKLPSPILRACLLAILGDTAEIKEEGNS